MTSETRIELEDGKYTYVQNGGEQYALRYGEPWRDLTGDKFTYCLAARIVELEELNKALQAKIDLMLQKYVTRYQEQHENND